ncbi:MAG: hypothetical protein IKW83_06530 [Muribaculaceae bacterium]|nr:hypothetical protein [Muribaculaceae bacterium]
MTIEYLKLIKIDHENSNVQEEALNDEGNVKDYIMAIIDQITDNAGERRYEFKNGELTMKTCIDDIVNNNNRDARIMDIARRLLQKEEAAQQRYQNITDIQKGILLIAYCKMTDTEYKMVICKADYSEFIEEITGEMKNGLPTKKKIFKSFAANITINDETFKFGDMVTFDVNAKQSKYWYDEFLDLKVLHDDGENTEKALKFLKSKILAQVWKKSKSDYLVLWNSTMAYMRSEGEFSMDHYADNILAVYQPVVTSLNMEELARKAKALPRQFDFDGRFQKVPSKIKDKMKNEIKLTDDINLVLKNDVPNLSRTIKPHNENGEKYIMVRSEEGYKYAESLVTIVEQQV